MFSNVFDEYSNDTYFYLGGLNNELLEEYYKNIEEEDNKYYDKLLHYYDNDYDDYDDY
tara:strand:+ start:207 stop:380 length:174 start_codon:yes stop_codon:yes gene_type:complete